MVEAVPFQKNPLRAFHARRRSFILTGFPIASGDLRGKESYS
jgi:hypothetical protein